MSRKPCPSDVSDAEWSSLAPYPALMREDAPQRVRPFRELLDGLRYALRAGGAWRTMPHGLPPWHAVHRRARRRIARGRSEAAAHGLREILRLEEGRRAPPTAAILDGRVLRSTPESGHRAGHSGAKGTKGSKAHLAVGTLGCLMLAALGAWLQGAEHPLGGRSREHRILDDRLGRRAFKPLLAELSPEEVRELAAELAQRAEPPQKTERDRLGPLRWHPQQGRPRSGGVPAGDQGGVGPRHQPRRGDLLKRRAPALVQGPKFP